MSFLTEYFDEFRQHPIKKTVMCRPENRYAHLEGKWLDPKVGTDDRKWTDEEIQQFVKDTMKSLRGQSTYYNDFCSHLSQEFKTRPFVPKPKKKRWAVQKDGEKVEEEVIVPEPSVEKLAIKDTELMRLAHALYERDMDAPTLEPRPTHFRS